MFTYKYCQKCQKRNHKKRENCVRCGDQLLNNPKFGINVFAVTLSIIVLLSAASVYAGKSYFSIKSDTSQPNTQIQEVEPKQEDIKPVISQEPAKEEVESVPVTEMPVKKEKVVTPQVTAPPVATPTCDEDQKAFFTSKFKVGYNDARSVMLGKMNPDSTPAEDQAAMDENITKIDYLYRQYLQDMKNINCTAEALVGGLIPSY